MEHRTRYMELTPQDFTALDEVAPASWSKPFATTTCPQCSGARQMITRTAYRTQSGSVGEKHTLFDCPLCYGAGTITAARFTDYMRGTRHRAKRDMWGVNPDNAASRLGITVLELRDMENGWVSTTRLSQSPWGETPGAQPASPPPQ